MKSDFVKYMILNICDEKIQDAKDGYGIIKSEYWFGRLCVAEEIKKEIDNILKSRSE